MAVNMEAFRDVQGLSLYTRTSRKKQEADSESNYSTDKSKHAQAEGYILETSWTIDDNLGILYQYMPPNLR